MKSLLLLLLLAGCAKPKYADEGGNVAVGGGPARSEHTACFRVGTCISYSWEKLPTEEEFGSFEFRTRPADPPFPPAVVLWMPAMGHGSSPVKVERLGAGEYRASNVFFTMKGDWQLRFQLRDGREVKDEIVLPYTFD